MSVVLYALGAALLLWGGYVLLSGDMIATLDIAASLAGSGVFAIGLGAVAAAIKRLARVIAERSVPLGAEASARDMARRDRDLPPLQELRRAAPPAHEPEARVEPTPAGKVEPDLAAAIERDIEAAPPPPRRPRIEVAPARPPAPAPADASAPSKAERRLRAREEAQADAELPLPAPAVTIPPVVSPILGGGFAASRPELESDSAPEPAAAREPTPEPQPEAPPVAEPADAVVEPAPEPEPAVEPRAEPEAPVVAPPPPEKRLPEPKVPEWLARARARREARAVAGEQAQDSPPQVPAAAPDEAEPTPPVEPEPGPPDELQPTPPDEPEDDPSAEQPLERVVLREGEHNGVLYRFFADGSVEAQSEHGMRRFDSLEELRATVLAVRGHIEGEDEDDPAARPEAEMMVDPSVEATPVPAAAEGAAEPEPEPAPALNPAGPHDEFEAALAALENGLGDDRTPNRAAPSPGDIRPGRDR